MDLFGFIGWPQIAALVVLAQRALEDVYSTRNMRALIAAGGREEGASFYPAVAGAQLGWLAACFLLIPASAPVVWPALVAYLALQPVRYWIIASLGRWWTYRIVVIDGMTLVRTGPYRFVRHPNYVVSVAETALLPLAFGAWALAIACTAVYGAVILRKIHLEDRALAAAVAARLS